MIILKKYLYILNDVDRKIRTNNNLENFNFELKIYSDSVYVGNEFAGLKLNYVSRGIKVGDITNGRIIPHHQFFKVYGEFFKNKVELTFEQMKDYLRGLEVKLENGLKNFCLML